MISYEDARGRVLARVRAASAVEVELRDALGLVLAEDVVATEAIPPFANTAVDGYALSARETAAVPVRLAVVDEIRAGVWPTREIGPGEAARIMTGAPLPPGADAIVMVEETELDGDRVVVHATVRPGESVRPAGDDVAPGTLVLERATVLGPAHLGVLAELGRVRVRVHPRPLVAVVSTGDELVGGGGPLAPGQIRESNGELLVALLAQAGCRVENFGIVADDKDALRRALSDAASRCDAIITSGGVSMGDYDLVRVVLDELGAMEWMQIAIRPAKPFAFGVIATEHGEVPVFGLPGNPVSSMVSFELLARPALLQMMGYPRVERPIVAAIADAAIGRNASDERVNFVRVVAQLGPDGRVHVSPTGAQGSHQLASSAAATGFARIDDGAGVPEGGEVAVLLIGVQPGQL